MQQLCTVLDNKANIEDINKVFQELHSELLEKVNSNEFKGWKQKQILVNESLC